MIDFDKEIKRFKPSTDIKDIDYSVVNSDIIDMNDIDILLMSELINKNNQKNI